MRIWFDVHAGYFAGEMVSGNCVLVIDKPVALAGVDIILHRHIDANAKSVHVNRSEDGIVEHRFYEQVGSLMPGEYKFGFHFLIPNGYPSSSLGWESSAMTLGVRYQLRAQVTQQHGQPPIEAQQGLVVMADDEEFEAFPKSTELKRDRTTVTCHLERNMFFTFEAPTLLLQVKSENKIGLTLRIDLIRKATMQTEKLPVVETQTVASQVLQIVPFYYGVRVISFNEVPTDKLTASFKVGGTSVEWLVGLKLGWSSMAFLPFKFGNAESFGQHLPPKLHEPTPWIELRPPWEPDQTVCFLCNSPMTSSIRFWEKKTRRHCRFCMRSVCSDCSTDTLEEKDYGYSKRHRACKACLAQKPALMQPPNLITAQDFVVLLKRPPSKPYIEPCTFVRVGDPKPQMLAPANGCVMCGAPMFEPKCRRCGFEAPLEGVKFHVQGNIRALDEAPPPYETAIMAPQAALLHPQAIPPPQQGWQCMACTFVNSDENILKCDVCETPRFV